MNKAIVREKLEQIQKHYRRNPAAHKSSLDEKPKYGSHKKG